MNQKILYTISSLFILLQSFAQTDTITNRTPLDSVLVYATKFPEKFKFIAQSVQTITGFSAVNVPSNTGDVLINSGSVFVQKSQQGGSSPVIRGFEASRILLMVDGIRQNSAIFRAGHLQNIITIDNAILDRVEVLYGPSSTIYGSDALGGVVNMFTKNPVLSNSGKTAINGNAFAKYATAIEESRAHIDFNIANNKWAALTSVTYGIFGDMIQGNNRPASMGNLGLKPFIVRRFGNTDSAFVNPNPNKQTPSGYKQVDFMQKFLFKPNTNTAHILNIQLSNSTDVPRYDRLSEFDNGAPVFAEWYYGPQIRNLIAYHFNTEKLNGFFQQVKANVSFQDLEESRITRRFKNNNKDYRWERVNIIGATIDVKHYSEKNELQVGVESYTNYVKSTAERRNIVTNAVSRIVTRYSDGPTKMGYNALYAQHTYKINRQFTLNEGVRLNLVQLNAVFADTAIMNFPFKQATQQNIALTGNLGLVYNNEKNTRIAFLVSSGFRSPNVDDLTKVFDTRTNYVVVPNPNLKPEYTYNAEFNFNKYGKKLSYGGSVFYTWFNNALVVDKFNFNGKDSIIYQNVNSAVYAPQNKATAYLYGFSVNAAYNILSNTTVNGTFTYTYGRFRDKGVVVPLDHIPPTFGKIALQQKLKNFTGEFFCLFNGWKRLKDYSESGEDNLRYATPNGMPAWYTLNLQTLYHFNKYLSLQLAVENILDRNYRYFASGISAPGRNFVITLRTTF